MRITQCINVHEHASGWEDGLVGKYQVGVWNIGSIVIRWVGELMSWWVCDGLVGILADIHVKRLVSGCEGWCRQ